jgi:hypothetical protein
MTRLPGLPSMARGSFVAWTTIVAGVLTLALIAATIAPPPQLEANLVAAQISADGGFAYTTPIPLRPPVGYMVDGDRPDGVVSNLRLRENGQPLGAAHSAHADIRERGQGRYSHWQRWLYFSASDSSDPRTNGRTYSVSATASVHPYALVAVALIDVLALIAARSWLMRFRRAVANVAIAAALVLAALAAAGALGRINDSAGSPKDAALVVATLMHALFGCVILIAQWIAGAGIARLVLGARRGAPANVLLLGFALSLPIAAILAVVSLLYPYGSGLAAVIWLVCCLPLRNWRPAGAELAAVLRVGIALLPFAIGFGCWMGLNWHGPTETLAGSASGDLVYYSTSIVSLSTQLYPYLNLGYEQAPLDFYFNMLFPLLGAALSRVVTFDPFLFIAAGGGASFVLSLGLTLHLYIQGTGILTRGAHAALSSLVLALAIVAAIRYPYWIVESIPMIHAVPLTLVVVYWARKNDARARLLAFVLAVVGSALSKVVGAAVLAPFAFASAVPRFFRMSYPVRVAAIVAAVAAAVYGAVLLYQVGPMNFAVAPLGPLSVAMIQRYHADFWTVLPFAMRDVSAVLLAVVAFVLADWLVASTIAFGFLLFLVYPFVLQFDFVCAVIILGLVACDHPDRLWKFRMLVLGALLLAVPAALLTDPAGVSSGLAWLVCIGGTIWTALPRQRPPAWPGMGRTAAAAALLLCLGLVAVGRGYLIVTSGWQPGVLTPQVRQIWLAVKQRTPPDALIFTDQTGIEPTLLGSWNTYAFIGARQIFVSNLYMNAVTRSNRELALDVLRENDAVLNGKSPAQLALRGRYSGYFAVVSRARLVPIQWVKLFENEQYALYGIPAG